MVKIVFQGGAQEVGRSSFLVKDKEKILLDHGIKLSLPITEYPVLAKERPDVAVISHAHLDHSGFLPNIFRKLAPLSYMTPPTFHLSRILWKDTLKIAEIEANELPPYTKNEIARTEKYIFPLSYRKQMEITPHASIEFFDAGHILGSAITRLELSDKTLVYTGDFMLSESRLHEGAELPKKCDFLIIESTYGDREHSDRMKTEKNFVQAIQETIDNGGCAMLPAFAIGRSQELLAILHEYNLDSEIYFDGMGLEASKVYLNYASYVKEPKRLYSAFESVQKIKKSTERRKVLKKPCIILTTAGMLQGGPIYYYLKHLHGDKRSSIFLSGFQVHETPGSVLMKTRKIGLDEEVVEVNCRIEKFDFSAHASHSELLSAIKHLSPEKVVLVHGDKEVQTKFSAELKKEGFKVFVPKVGEELNL